MIVKTYITDAAMRTNTHVAYCERTRIGVLIDPGKQCAAPFAYIRENGIKIEYIVNTHTHPDHCFGNADAFKQFDAPVLLHKRDHKRLTSMEKARFIPRSDGPVQHTVDGQVLRIGRTKLTVVETPGHTDGSISLIDSHVLFTGDSITLETPPNGDASIHFANRQTQTVYMSRILRLIESGKGVTVYPGHGPPFGLSDYPVKTA